MKIKGKYYDNNFVALLSTLLYNLRIISSFALMCNLLPTIEKATTAYGLDDETCFWGICWIVVTFCLLKYHKKMTVIYDKITDIVYSKIK